MKKIYLLGCLATLAASGAFAQTTPKPDNEAFYLVGTMNDWHLPDTGKAIKIADEDGDGIYTGSVYVPETEPEFKVFSQVADSWETEDYYGTWTYPVCIFNGEPYKEELKPGYGSSNICIGNWGGGDLQISIQWVKSGASWMPEITLYGDNQPEFPVEPEYYLIGEFNNWQLPSKNSDNDAKKLSNISNVTNYFHADQSFDFEANSRNTKFAFCALDTIANTAKVLEIPKEYNTPFTLYSYKITNDSTYNSSIAMNGIWVETNSPKSYALTLTDWLGGTINFSVYDSYVNSNRGEIIIGAESTPAVEKPESLYFIVEKNGEKTLFPCDDYNKEGYFNFFVREETNKGDVSITLTCENSLNPDPANCWGVSRKTLTGDSFKQYQLVKGGNPFSYSFPGGGSLGISFALPLSIANVYIESRYDFSQAEKLYVCGDVENNGVKNGFTAPSAGNQTLYDENFRLEKISEGVFEGTYLVYPKDVDPEYYYFPDSLPQFRFFSELVGWRTEYSIGSNQADFYCLAVDLENGPVETPLIYNGLGNWGPCLGETWTEAYVKMTVDLNNCTLRLERIETGVNEMEAASVGVEKWFNLQGLPVEKPENGLFIHIVDGKSRVEAVK